MNSGATKPYPHPRGRETVLSLSDYPIEDWKRRRPRGEWVVELLVARGIPDIVSYVDEAKHVQGGLAEELVYQRRGQMKACGA